MLTQPAETEMLIYFLNTAAWSAFLCCDHRQHSSAALL